MNEQFIQTSQNVQIENNIASIGDRMAAAMIDAIFLFSYIFIAIMIFSTNGIQNYWLLSIILIPFALYHLLFETFNEGQSPKKKIMKIRVVKSNGSTPQFMDYFLRWIFRVIDIVLTQTLLAIITIIFTKKHQRVGDMAASTLVVRFDRKNSLNDTVFVDVPKDHEVKYPQVIELSDKDVYIVNQVVNLAEKEGYNAKVMNLLKKTSHNIKSKLGIKSGMPLHLFLKQIILDYNYLSVNQ